MIGPPEGELGRHMRIIAAALMESETTHSHAWPIDEARERRWDGAPPNHQKLHIIRKLCEAENADLFSPADYEKMYQIDAGGMAQAGFYLADMRSQFFNRLCEVATELDATIEDRLVWKTMALNHFSWAVTFRTRMELHHMTTQVANGAS